eukprot:Polyplicarium_translucidae@DN2276_c0_g1_i1.p1
MLADLALVGSDTTRTGSRGAQRRSVLWLRIFTELAGLLPETRKETRREASEFLDEEMEEELLVGATTLVADLNAKLRKRTNEGANDCMEAPRGTNMEEEIVRLGVENLAALFGRATHRSKRWSEKCSKRCVKHRNGSEIVAFPELVQLLSLMPSSHANAAAGTLMAIFNVLTQCQRGSIAKLPRLRVPVIEMRKDSAATQCKSLPCFSWAVTNAERLLSVAEECDFVESLCGTFLILHSEFERKSEAITSQIVEAAKALSAARAEEASQSGMQFSKDELEDRDGSATAENGPGLVDDRENAEAMEQHIILASLGAVIAALAADNTQASRRIHQILNDEAIEKLLETLRLFVVFQDRAGMLGLESLVVFHSIMKALKPAKASR